MTGTRPPYDLQRKTAPAALEVDAPDPATGVVAVDEDTGVVEAIAAVTAIRDEVGDVIEVGALTKSLRRQTPRLCVAHEWSRIAGRITSAVELMPGDPRLPATGPDGQPWPRQAGALLIKARYILGTREGREAFEVAKAFDTDMAYSIGYRVRDGGARTRNGTRYISDLDVYEVSSVLHGANRYARQLSVKSAQGTGYEFKATAGAVSAVRRSRLWHPVTCAVCGNPAGGTTTVLPASARVICDECTSALDDLAVDGGVITPEQLAEAAAIDDEGEPTPEEAYAAALDGEQRWDMESDGTLSPATDDPTRGRAWGADPRRAWGRP